MVSVVVAGSYERAQYVVETAVEPVPGPLSSQHLHEFCGALHLFHCVDCLWDTTGWLYNLVITRVVLLGKRSLCAQAVPHEPWTFTLPPTALR